jgi:hypothetical protein
MDQETISRENSALGIRLSVVEDTRDALIEEIEVADDGTIYLNNGDNDELAIISSQQEYEKMLADEATQAGEG